MSRLTTIALVITAVLVGGCGGGSGSREEGHVADVALPVDVRAALASAEDRAAPARTEQLLIQRCMEDRGLPYVPPSDGDARSSERWYRLEDLYQFGPPPGTDQQDYGLSRSRAAFESSVADPNAKAVERLSERARATWDEALNGTGDHLVEFLDPTTGTSYAASTDGCRTRAQVELYGSFGAYMELSGYSGRFASTVRSRVAAEPQAEAARERWAACARKRGFEMEHPSEPFGQAVVAYEGGADAGAAALERRNHELAVHCEAEAHVHQLGWRLTEELLPVVMEDEAGLVARYRDVIRASREVLAAAD